jgi:hypothetical protein
MANTSRYIQSGSDKTESGGPAQPDEGMRISRRAVEMECVLRTQVRYAHGFALSARLQAGMRVPACVSAPL